MGVRRVIRLLRGWGHRLVCLTYGHRYIDLMADRKRCVTCGRWRDR